MDKKVPAVGTRAQVMHGNAKHTSGGLTKNDLKYNDRGQIVSVKKSEIAKQRYKENGLKPASAEEMKHLRSLRK